MSKTCLNCNYYVTVPAPGEGWQPDAKRVPSCCFGYMPKKDGVPNECEMWTTAAGEEETGETEKKKKEEEEETKTDGEENRA